MLLRVMQVSAHREDFLISFMQWITYNLSSLTSSVVLLRTSSHWIASSFDKYLGKAIERLELMPK